MVRSKQPVANDARGDFKSVVNDRGFAVLPEYRVGTDSPTAFGSLGDVMTVPGVGAVQVLKPRDLHDAPSNIYSGNFGLREFPLHTDLAHWYFPPRYLALRCCIGTSDVATLMLDGEQLLRNFGELTLRTTLVAPRKPVDGRRPLMPLFEKDDVSGDRLRWDSLFLVAGTKRSAAVIAKIQSYIASVTPTAVTLREPGDTLVIDNWRVLHGRSAVRAKDSQRHIERAYLGGLH
jgi:L-asparagine oxygenase